MATWSNLSLQDSNSPLMEQLSFFHDHTMMILIIISSIVGYFLMYNMKNIMSYRMMIHGHLLETFWTIIPAMILVCVALPSIKMLYLMDDNNDPMLTIKTIGRQWYWSYEYSDFKQIEFDSYMISYNEYENSSFRNLEVDNYMVIPMNSSIRLLASASDVIHSWTIPSLGIKVDATPGRINQSSFFINRPGILYGQCSEICGANHSFMPIMIESTSSKLFIEWIKKMM
uniref:cytochrome c oxidase subunit II n=1 Tax=Erianthus versicolor TaxID=470935 RepID=UPI0024114CED|nr:cytochrome c oxidase subunit II [Erianthus versicolor]WEL32786.1 cytochrome c oxidase subunit II [Erianthus versicolor]